MAGSSSSAPGRQRRLAVHGVAGVTPIRYAYCPTQPKGWVIKRSGRDRPYLLTKGRWTYFRALARTFDTREEAEAWLREWNFAPSTLRGFVICGGGGEAQP